MRSVQLSSRENTHTRAAERHTSWSHKPNNIRKYDITKSDTGNHEVADLMTDYMSLT